MVRRGINYLKKREIKGNRYDKRKIIEEIDPNGRFKKSGIIKIRQSTSK